MRSIRPLIVFVGLAFALGGAQAPPAEALLTAPELIDARLKYIQKLNAGQKFREALRELVELRAEIPRRLGLQIDYQIGLCYRAIADAICEGYMGENQGGELIYRSEAGGYEWFGTNRSKMASFQATDLTGGRPVTNWVKRTRVVSAVGGQLFLTNFRSQVLLVTNASNEMVVSSNFVAVETVTTNMDVSETYVTNTTSTSYEAAVTNFSFVSNTVTVTNLDIVSNISVLTNRVVVTNLPKVKTGEKSFESIIYEFYPGMSGLKALKKLQTQTNLDVQTRVSATTNSSVASRLVVITNSDISNYTVKGEDRITITTNRQETPREIRTPANYWAFTTNEISRPWVSTNEIVETNVVTRQSSSYTNIEESVPVVSYETPMLVKRKRALTPLALKYYDLAIRWFNRLIANSFENPFQETALLRKGEVYRDIEQSTLALEVFGQFQRQFPRSPQVLAAMIERANLYVSLDRPFDAATVIREAMEVYPDSDQKAFLQLKLDYLSALSGRNTRGILVPAHELARKARQLEEFEAQLIKKEQRLSDLKTPLKP